MSEEFQKTWEMALVLVRERLDNAREFNAWFKPMSVVSQREDEITIGVPDALFSDWLIENGYERLLLESLREVSGNDFQVRYEARTEKVVEEPKKTSTPAVIQRSTPTADLLPDYTFDHFVVGSSNQFAYAACRAVADNPAANYNPLFIYGGVGLGKTHLVHAIGNDILGRDPRAKVKYITSESYVNDLIDSLGKRRMQEFRQRYRNECDVLLIDDIQFIANKAGTQEEFFHTFNALYGASKQIVFTSDRFPEEIPSLEERLRSRFQWGLIADIKPPRIETRVAILKKKAGFLDISLPDDVAMFIATRVRSNVRQLEGALIRLEAFSSLNATDITSSMAREVLRDFLPDADRQLTAEDIIRMAGAYFGVKPGDIKGARRHKAVSLPRQVAMYLTRRHTNLSYPEIGSRFGDRDHTTVMSGVRKIERLLKQGDDALLKKAVEILERQIQSHNE